MKRSSCLRSHATRTFQKITFCQSIVKRVFVVCQPSGAWIKTLVTRGHYQELTVSQKHWEKSGDELTGPVERHTVPVRPAKYMNIISIHYMAVCIDKSGSHKAQHVTSCRGWQTSYALTCTHALSIMNAKYYNINYTEVALAVWLWNHLPFESHVL